MGVSRGLVVNVEWGIKSDYFIFVIVITATTRDATDTTNSRRPWCLPAVVPDGFSLQAFHNSVGYFTKSDWPEFHN